MDRLADGQGVHQQRLGVGVNGQLPIEVADCLHKICLVTRLILKLVNFMSTLIKDFTRCDSLPFGFIGVGELEHSFYKGYYVGK